MITGSPNIDPQYRSRSELSLINGSNVLNVTDDQILREWRNEQQNDYQQLHLFIVGGIIIVIVCAVAVSIGSCIFVCCWKTYRK